jgi:putative MATE family efflux protein
MGLALVVFILVKLFNGPLLEVIIESNAVRETSFDFLRFRIWGIFFAHTNFIFRAFYVGIGRTRVITFTTLVMVSVNVILDYSLIFGNFGFPQMGVSGAALASVIAEAFCSVSFIVYTLSRIPLKKFRLFSFKVFSPRLLVRLLKVSLPMMLQNFFSFSVWFIFFLIIEKMGESELAISNIIRSIYIVLLIPIMGFSSATNTLVSYVIGQGKHHDVLKTIAKTAFVCASGVFLITIICWVFPEAILSVYTNDDSLIKLGIPILHIISISSVLLALGNVLFNGVSGTGKTNVSLAIEVIILAIYLFATYIMVQHLKVSVSLVWGAEIIYGVLLSIASYIYLKSGRWVGKRV